MDTEAKEPDLGKTTTGRRGGARREPGILRWVILSVAGCFLAQFLTSLLLMLTGAVELGQSKFVTLARENYMGFLAWKSLMLLVKGYGLLCVVYVVICFPLISLWVKKRAKRITRWSVIWRTVALVMASVMLMILRLFWKQPYFSSEGWVVEPVMNFLSTVPEGPKFVVLGLLFDGLPWVIALVVVGFYALAYHRVTIRLAPRRRWIAYGATSMVIAGVAVMFLVPREGSGGTVKDLKAGESRPMNVLIITSDSLRGDKLSCNGYFREVSPNIDALAAESTNFTKCFTPIGSTLESMTSLMTAQYPHTHGFRQMFPDKELVDRVNADSATLAWILRQKGYDTAVLGDWCAAIYNLTPMGFEEGKVSDYDNFKIWLSQAVYMQQGVAGNLPLAAAFAVVPPMSKLMMLVSPTCRADQAAASTPAAGPDSRQKTGRDAASCAGVRPPADCMISSGAATPRWPNPSPRASR